MTRRRNIPSQVDWRKLAPKQNRACDICKVADIPSGVDWPYWDDDKPVHFSCACKRMQSELLAK